VALKVDRVSVAGTWWRQIPHGSDPLWLSTPPSSGRWQRGEHLAALYFADEAETAWAEWYRMLAEIGMSPTHGMPRDLWHWTIAVDDIADLIWTLICQVASTECPRWWRASVSVEEAAGPAWCATRGQTDMRGSGWPQDRFSS